MCGIAPVPSSNDDLQNITLDTGVSTKRRKSYILPEGIAAGSDDIVMITPARGHPLPAGPKLCSHY